MRTTYIKIIVGACALLTGCTKKFEVNGGTPDLAVSVEAKTFRAGEPVPFSFTGRAGLISFYSGEVFHDYGFKDGRVLEAGQLDLSFNTSVQFGTQANQFSVHVSSDFNGDYKSFANVQAATWSDITSRFAIGSSATYVPSGVKNISDLVQPGKPLYIAFKYVYKPSAANGLRRTWRVQNFLLTSTTGALGKQTVGTMTSSGFTLVDQNPATEPAATTISATTLSLVGTAINPSLLTSENWVISKGFATGEVDLGPDRPVPIKAIADPQLTRFEYTYSKPGTYNVYFIASNANVHESKQRIQKLEITIVP